MRRTGFILALILLLAAYHTVGVIWSIKAKIYFVVGMLIAWTAAAVVTGIMHRRLKKNFEDMDDKIREQLLAEHPDVIEAMSATPVVHWKWKLLDTVLALLFMFTPFLMVSIATKQTVSWNSKFTGYHLLALAGGLGIYYLGRTIMIKWWKSKQ